MDDRKCTEIRDEFGGCHALFASPIGDKYGIDHISIGPILRGTRASEHIPEDVARIVQVTIRFDTIHRWFFKSEKAAKKVYDELMALAQS